MGMEKPENTTANRYTLAKVTPEIFCLNVIFVHFYKNSNILLIAKKSNMTKNMVARFVLFCKFACQIKILWVTQV